MANILNCCAIYFGCSRENYSEAVDFRVLVDCSKQKKMKKLKEA